jgi:hypothetical protein
MKHKFLAVVLCAFQLAFCISAYAEPDDTTTHPYAKPPASSRTTLLQSIARSDATRTKQLLVSGINPNFTTAFLEPLTTSLVDGQSSKDAELVRRQLSEMPFDSRYLNQMSSESRMRLAAFGSMMNIDGTPLMLASLLCNQPAIEHLIHARADVNAVGNFRGTTTRTTSLGLAVGAACAPAVKALLAAGANVNAGPSSTERPYAQVGLIVGGNLVVMNATKNRPPMLAILDMLESAGLPARAISVFRERYASPN